MCRMKRTVPGVLAALVSACSATAPMPDPAATAPVTMALVNARIWTGDPAAPWAEALAVSGEQLAAVGTNAAVRTLAAGGTPVDAGGRLVVPGFIDTHQHFYEGGLRLASVQLRDAATRDAFVRRIAAFAATVPAGTWITGGDWDHTLWGGDALSTSPMALSLSRPVGSPLVPRTISPPGTSPVARVTPAAFSAALLASAM
jgi:hypothetical protein